LRRRGLARRLQARFRAASAVCLFLLLPSCSASPAEAGREEAAPTTSASPAAPPTGRLAEAVRDGRKVEVGVFGDSFSDGLWWGLDQEFRQGDIAGMHRFGKPATGFTDYTRTDLLAHIRAKLDSKPIDMAVIMFGANDTQPLHGAETPTPYLSDKWKQVVGGRIEAVISLMKERGVTIVWIGLPKMRADNYDERVRRLNDFYAGEMRRHGVPYLETVSLTSDASGSYVTTIKGGEGQARSARTNDGIHMTMSGYRVLATSLAQRLRAIIDDTRRAVAHRDR
jgi:hypothetical protein